MTIKTRKLKLHDSFSIFFNITNKRIPDDCIIFLSTIISCFICQKFFPIYNVRNKKMPIENIYIIHKNLPSVSTKTVETVNMVNVSKFQLKTVARQYWQLSLLIAY